MSEKKVNEPSKEAIANFTKEILRLFYKYKSIKQNEE